MEEILKLLLEKPLAFILTIGGILFLGLSGLTRFFKVTVHPANSKRLFMAGICLVLIGIPIYYFVDNTDSQKLEVELLKVEYFKNDMGLICDSETSINVRETLRIENVNGEKLVKVILNGNKMRYQDIVYQDADKNFAINYCFQKGLERNIKSMVITNSGKASNLIEYEINTTNPESAQETAPSLSNY